MTMPRLAKRTDKPRRPGYSLAGWIILLSLITTPLWSADQDEKPKGFAPPNSPQPVIREMSREERESREHIKRISVYTLEEAEESLCTNYRDQQLVFGAGMNGDASPNSIVHEVIADYRVKLIYLAIQKMPADAAARHTEDLFDRILKQYQADIREVTTKYGGRVTWHNFPAYHGLSASLFLCAVYTPPATYLKKLEQWQQEMGRTVKEFQSSPQFTPPRLPLEIRDAYGYPQPLLVLNLHVFVLGKRQQMTTTMIEKHLGRRLPQFREAPFLSLNYQVFDRPLLPYAQGVLPPQPDEILEVFVVAKNGFHGDYDSLMKTVNQVGALIKTE